MSEQFRVAAVASIESPLRPGAPGPRQATEDAPAAVVVFDAAFGAAAADIHRGDELVLLTWLDQADRSVLAVRPRRDGTRPLTGVFSTRSPSRPNPIGLHPVRVTAVEGLRVSVDALEAFDGTPVVDVKSLRRDLDPA